MPWLNQFAAPVAALFIAACAATPVPQYPADHPANPAAQSGTAAESTTLSDYGDGTPTPPATAPGLQKENPRAGHR